MNDHRINKVYNLIKFLTFPYGILCLVIPWLGLCELFFKLCSNNAQQIPVNTKLFVAILGSLLIVLYILYLNYYIQPSKKNTITIYIIVAPEELENDKYITSDVYKNIKENLERDGLSWQVVVPRLLTRYKFLKRVEKTPKYFESKSCSRTHKRLKGCMYLIGYMKLRNDDEEKIVFDIITFIACQKNKSEYVDNLVIRKLYETVYKQYLISRKYEYQQLALFSSQYANAIQFLVGITHFSIGNLFAAYAIHLKLFKERRNGFKELHDNTKEIVEIELTIIIDYYSRLLDYETAIKYIDEFIEISPQNKSFLLAKARLVLQACYKNDDYTSAIPRASSLVDSVKIDSDNRMSFHLSKGYVSLLRGHYDDAEKSYNIAFKTQNKDLVKSTLDYCVTVINSTFKELEKPTAYYVKALLLHYGLKEEKKALEAFKLVLSVLDNDGSYYCRKVPSRVLRKLVCSPGRTQSASYGISR